MIKVTEVTKVEKIAWNIERVHLKGENGTIVMDLTSPEDHGQYTVGALTDEQTVEAAKPKTTKKTSKKSKKVNA